MTNNDIDTRPDVKESANVRIYSPDEIRLYDDFITACADGDLEEVKALLASADNPAEMVLYKNGEGINLAFANKHYEVMSAIFEVVSKEHIDEVLGCFSDIGDELTAFMEEMESQSQTR